MPVAPDGDGAVGLCEMAYAIDFVEVGAFYGGSRRRALGRFPGRLEAWCFRMWRGPLCRMDRFKVGYFTFSLLTKVELFSRKHLREFSCIC